MDFSGTGIDELVDDGTFRPQDLDLRSRDPLRYPDYGGALTRASDRAGTDESVVAGSASIEGHAVEVALFNFSFMGGSMGEVAGERLARALERAARRGVPFVLRTATGGARMQEGMRSLIQMPKVVAARLTLAEAHQPFIAILGHPTTGGVFASVASLADVTIAEEEATIGFAGPRVAERVTGAALSPGSHTASFAYDNGMVDDVVASGRIKDRIAHALRWLAPDEPLAAPGEPPPSPSGDATEPWEAVRAVRARKKGRRAPIVPWAGSDAPLALEGDRAGSTGGGVDAWIARAEGRRFLLLAVGDPLTPPGFRKALRGIDIATRLDIRIVTLIDSAGADPSVGSEEQGIAGLIARVTEAMLAAPVPVLAIVTGEGGSGGALAFATADRLIAYESSYFSVIGPEAAAEILWKEPGRAPEAARLLKLTARDLLELGIADEVVAGEPDPASLRRVVTYHLAGLTQERPAPDRAARRRRRWRDTW